MTEPAEWLQSFAERTGISAPSEDDECKDSLEFARLAAHASMRLASPLSTYLVGRAGLRPGGSLELARGLVSELEQLGGTAERRL